MEDEDKKNTLNNRFWNWISKLIQSWLCGMVFILIVKFLIWFAGFIFK